MKGYVFGFIGLALFYAAFAAGGDVKWSLRTVLPASEVGNLREQLLDEHPVLTGEFTGAGSRASRLCPSGAWSYYARITTPLKNLNLELKDDNSLAVVAEFGDIDGYASGSLRNRATICRKVRVGTPFGADGAQIYAKVSFRGEPSDFSNAEVRIESTRLDRLHFQSWVPQTLGDMLTDLSNGALAHVWKSRVGTWISDYISKKLRDGFPGAP